ncbi:PAS domain S-box protein [Paucibacter sp. APW11]|uniref:histidine kinase n=1 Tax=Roseateles aquae TaxID=3077235 RepID=A0ABU3P8N1_9BURK|nr:PAS domain S-box protein [Paucibacter sp. APW11]MDT8998848.1 PAS domain S-box protein [Paucibacter sp. APW11]
MSATLWARLGHGYGAAWLTALLSLLICTGLIQLQQYYQADQERQRVETRLGQLRSQLEGAAQATFSPTLGLEAMIQLDGDLSEERFQALTTRVVRMVPHIRSIVAAPNDIARHVYPLAGNERVQGLDYRSIPQQWQQVQAARKRGAPLLVGPVNLVQGGQGLIQRTPVFLRQDGEERLGHYWGVVSVVADLPRFLAAAGLNDSSGLDIAVVESSASGTIGRLITGQAAVLSLQPARQLTQLPGAQWMLLAVPAGGWEAEPPWQNPQALAAIFAGVVITTLVFMLNRQSRALQKRNETLSNEIAQGRQAREQLEESQARFRSLAALASDWVWEQDEELRFTYVSRAAEEATEVNTNNVLGFRRWESPSLVPGVDWDAHMAALSRCEAFRDFEYAQYTADGSLRHVSVSGVPIFDADGRFRGYRGTGRNITPAKQAEAALRESQAALVLARDRLQAVLDAAIEVAIIATDMQGRVILFNRGAERMLGYQEEFMLGKSPAMLHLPSEVSARARELSAQLGQTIEGFETFVALPRRDGTESHDWTYLRQDGSTVQVSLNVSMVCGRNGVPLGFLGIARDISAQRRAEAELRTLNAELESRVQSRTAELSEALSHLRQAQDELLRSEKMAALGSLVAGVAHELNTPLGNCLTTASTLDERTRETQRAFAANTLRRSSLEAYLHDAATAAELLLRGLGTANELVTHFKQLSVDQTSAQRRNFRLSAVVGDVLSIMKARWKATPYRIETALALLDDDIDSYPGPLGQVLSNLLLNALLHAFEGREQGLLRISAREVGVDEIELVVEDDGVGMSEEVRRRAFDPFFTTKMGRGGTGLGLNIVYNIITGILGGQVELHSEAGHGCRFVFTLPRVAPELRSAS